MHRVGGGAQSVSMNVQPRDTAEYLRRANSGVLRVAFTERFETMDYRHDEHRIDKDDVVSAWAFAAVCVTAVMTVAALVAV